MFLTTPVRSRIVGLWAVTTLLIGLAIWFDGKAAPVRAQESKPFVYTSPSPNAKWIAPGTTIAVRPDGALDPASVSAQIFTVVGETSGVHTGEVVLANDGRTVIFRPSAFFEAGERVSVTIGAGLVTAMGEQIADTSFVFDVAPVDWARQNDVLPFPQHASSPPSPQQALLRDGSTLRNGGDDVRLLRIEEGEAGPIEPMSPAPLGASQVQDTPQSYVTVPDNFPTITIKTAATETADGYLFLSSYNGTDLQQSRPYLFILDNNGEPVFYKEMKPGSLTMDFKKQPNGLLTFYDTSVHLHHVMDNTYTIVDRFLIGNGYLNDAHDLQILPNGHILMLGFWYRTVDMSKIVPGGSTSARVIEAVIQEQDQDKNVIWEWRSWDEGNFDVTDTTVAPLTANNIDYIHANAVELDHDGNLLLSSRNLDEITKINRETGEIMWRWGGKRNQFTFVNDQPFLRQHDIRRLSNGNLTLFDNRTGALPQYSRAAEYHLDEENLRATLIWEYRNTPDTYAPWISNTQRLPNGNTLVGWGRSNPTITEVTPDGTKVFELALPPAVITYRSFRFPWQGAPPWPPTVVTGTQGLSTTLSISWNGATEIGSYQILADNSPTPTKMVQEVVRTGFETTLDVTSWDGAYCSVRIMPLDREGRPTVYSEPVALPNTTCTQQVYLPLLTGFLSSR